MSKIFTVPTDKLIAETALILKTEENMTPPAWSTFVKTGANTERPPQNPDWWFIRAASILRKVAKYNIIGVSKLRKAYGGKRNCGHKPDRVYLASGNIIRKMLQGLEKSGFVQQVEVKGHKGRKLTKKGKELLNSVVDKIQKESQKE